MRLRTYILVYLLISFLKYQLVHGKEEHFNKRDISNRRMSQDRIRTATTKREISQLVQDSARPIPTSSTIHKESPCGNTVAEESRHWQFALLFSSAEDREPCLAKIISFAKALTSRSCAQDKSGGVAILFSNGTANIREANKLKISNSRVRNSNDELAFLNLSGFKVTAEVSQSQPYSKKMKIYKSEFVPVRHWPSLVYKFQRKEDFSFFLIIRGVCHVHRMNQFKKFSYLLEDPLTRAGKDLHLENGGSLFQFRENETPVLVGMKSNGKKFYVASKKGMERRRSGSTSLSQFHNVLSSPESMDSISAFDPSRQQVLDSSPTAVPSDPFSVSPTPTSIPPNDINGFGISLIPVITGSIAAVVALLIIIVIIWFCRKRRSNQTIAPALPITQDSASSSTDRQPQEPPISPPPAPPPVNNEQPENLFQSTISDITIIVNKS